MARYGCDLSPEAQKLWSEGRYPSEFFTASEALQWIGAHRTPHNSRLDMQRTADRNGIYLAYASDPCQFPEWFNPLAAPLPTITLNSPYSREKERGLFGHGMGHFFHYLVAGLPERGMHDSFVEKFCNIFGQEMALPRGELAMTEAINEPRIVDIANRYGVGLRDVIFQFMRIGRLPLKLGVDIRMKPSGESTDQERIVRHYVCLHCKDGLARPCEPDVSSIPTLRFRGDFSATVDISCIRSMYDIRTAAGEHVRSPLS